MRKFMDGKGPFGTANIENTNKQQYRIWIC